MLGRRPVAFDLGHAAQLRADGRSLRAIAAELGVSAAKVHTALHGVQKTSPIEAHGEA